LPENDFIINYDDLILITGAGGFIGPKVVATLLQFGFRNLRCFVRPSSNTNTLMNILEKYTDAKVEVVQGNLVSRDDSRRATEGVSVIYHLAAGIEKSFPGCFLNSVIPTRNLLDSAMKDRTLKRFLNVSSFAVYSTEKLNRGGLLDENCEVENQFMERHEPYTFGKVKQDDLVKDYGIKFKVPYVIVRPGAVYGPGNSAISRRIGIDTFGIFLHLGSSNRIPLVYVDNCAEAISLAGLKKGIDGEIFNIVDDDLPRSYEFLKLYKKNSGFFHSISIPYHMFYLLCYIWEMYSKWSRGQLPPVFNRKMCAAYWKRVRYTNAKLKYRIGWKPKISFDEASSYFCEYLKNP
jgi:nucleoside-diphosphate-sugar epimerase